MVQSSIKFFLFRDRRVPRNRLLAGKVDEVQQLHIYVAEWCNRGRCLTPSSLVPNFKYVKIEGKALIYHLRKYQYIIGAFQTMEKSATYS